MKNDHRLGFPPVLLAIGWEPRKSQRTPLPAKLSEEEQEARRKLDVEKPVSASTEKWSYFFYPCAHAYRRVDSFGNVQIYAERDELGAQWRHSIASASELVRDFKEGLCQRIPSSSVPFPQS